MNAFIRRRGAATRRRRGSANEYFMRNFDSSLKSMNEDILICEFKIQKFQPILHTKIP